MGTDDVTDAPTAARQTKFDRREFLATLSLALVAVGSALVAIPISGFLLSPLVRKAPRLWRSVGAVDDFKIGETIEVKFIDASPLPWAGVAAQTAAWLRRETAQQFVAFAVNCTHLGCPVRWLPDADLFMCPCHGGVYDKEGRVAAGPPPEALFRYPVRVYGGQVEIQTSPLPTL
jgi:menaquinol-cytochrome c reductase iron-sulfur subunit